MTDVSESDLVLVSTDIRVGIMPGAGGTRRLVRTAGKQVAGLMLLCAAAGRRPALGRCTGAGEP